MQAPDLKSLLSEPIRNGIITGFAGMSAAAALQLASNLLTGAPGFSGVTGLLMAFALACAAGTSATMLSLRTWRRHKSESEMAAALARGDFSMSILQSEEQSSPMVHALVKIAERELEAETLQALAAKDASLRQDQLADALDAVPLEIAVYNRDVLLVSANRAFLARCHEIGAVVALGMTWHEVMASIAKAPGSNLPLNERQTWINQQEALRAESHSSSGFVRFTNNGRVNEILSTTSTDGNRTEILRDVTAFAESEDRAQRAQREAAAAERIKQVTLSRLSHTIRTPMTGVLAATELLADTDLDKRQRERLDIIRRSAGTLLGVVQDMFDMASDTQTTDETVVNPVMTRRTALVLDLPDTSMDETVASLNADGYEVGRAETVELLAEAIKLLAGQERSPELVKVPTFASRDLLISKLGGFEATSTLNIHVLETHPVANEVVAELHSNSKTVDLVIAESDEVSRIAYANALATSGLSFRIAGSGKETVSLARNLHSKLYLIDMTLPDMDGLETAAAIRKSNGGRPGFAPLVAMTSHFVSGDKAKCLANGMDEYVLKPTIGTEIVSMVFKLLEEQELKKAG